MKKIAFVLPYFGKLPNYFELWLNSAERNETIDFFIFTDQQIISSAPNIHVHKSNIGMIAERIRKCINAPFVINPYKLTDYKPAYGLIFEDYLKEYDFWGYCDCDLIFGRLRKFITDDILENYDKVYTHGHLTLLKNTFNNNRLFLIEHDFDCYRFDEVCVTNYPCHFDEGGFCEISDRIGLKTFNDIRFADIDFQKNNFNMVFIQDEFKDQIWSWEDGVLSRLYVDGKTIVKQEMEYIHLQKRKMDLGLSASDSLNGFLIVPNSFIDLKQLTAKEISEYNKSKFYLQKYIIRIRWLWKKLRWGAIQQRWRRWKKHRKHVKIR